MTEPSPMGKMSKKQVLWYGGAGLAGLTVVWLIMRRRSAAAPVEAPPMDTGYSAAGGGGGIPSAIGYYDPSSGSFVGGGGSPGTVWGPSTNAAWAQAVEAYLAAHGFSATEVAVAIGKYLTGQTLTSDQSSIVAAALGVFGHPPVQVPPISTAPPTGQDPPHILPWPQPDPNAHNVGGNVWTTVQASDKHLSDIITRIYGTPLSDVLNMSINDSYVRLANPGINFGHQLVVGTPIFMPPIPL